MYTLRKICFQISVRFSEPIVLFLSLISKTVFTLSSVMLCKMRQDLYRGPYQGLAQQQHKYNSFILKSVRLKVVSTFQRKLIFSSLCLQICSKGQHSPKAEFKTALLKKKTSFPPKKLQDLHRLRERTPTM